VTASEINRTSSTLLITP